MRSCGRTGTSGMPRTVSYGNSTDIVRNILKKTQAKHIVLITDKGVRRAGLTTAAENVITEMGRSLLVLDDIPPEPDYMAVQAIVDRVSGADLIIGFGGGSAMDTAKLVSLLAGSGTTVHDLLENPLNAKKTMHSVMIPTTCGTGAEATCNAIVAVPEDKVKVGIVNPEMIPDDVILDAETIRHLPPRIIAATGVDALAHAVECYTGNKANLLSDAYALHSARLIFRNIEAAYDNPDDMDAKQAMMIGAFFGGAAITASGTTAVHALSYPLGGAFHVPHGVSNAILFAPVMRFNQDAIEDRLSSLCDHVYPGLSQHSRQEKAQHIIDRIAAIVHHVQIPEHMTAFGVTEKDLDFMTESAFQVKRLLNNNMKELTKEDIRKIYLEVL